MEINFKLFLTEASKKFMTDLEETLNKIPKNHKKLVRNYKFETEKENTLAGDNQHVGCIDEKNKKIKIAAPWNYGREFTILHEIGHAVWKYLVTNEQKKKWTKISNQAKKTNKKLEKDNEEVFCMIYAQFYTQNKLEKFDEPELIQFVSSIK